MTVRSIGTVAAGRTHDVNVPTLASGKSTVVTVDALGILPKGVAVKDTTFRLDADITLVVAEPDETNNLKWHNQ